eukprot:2479774-Pyramimonas_sp.AAC.1
MCIRDRNCCRMTGILAMSLFIAPLFPRGHEGARVVGADADVDILVAGSLSALRRDVDRPSAYLRWRRLKS